MYSSCSGKLSHFDVVQDPVEQCATGEAEKSTAAFVLAIRWIATGEPGATLILEGSCSGWDVAADSYSVPG
jgi:hypothetical protein